MTQEEVWRIIMDPFPREQDDEQIRFMKIIYSSVVLFPVAVTFYITWWFIQFVGGFFSPIYERLGIDIFGLGFITSLIFIFFIGVFASSWLGPTFFWLREWFIKRMPFVKPLDPAPKPISPAISPDEVENQEKTKCQMCPDEFIAEQISTMKTKFQFLLGGYCKGCQKWIVDAEPPCDSGRRIKRGEKRSSPRLKKQKYETTDKKKTWKKWF